MGKDHTAKSSVSWQAERFLSALKLSIKTEDRETIGWSNGEKVTQPGEPSRRRGGDRDGGGEKKKVLRNIKKKRGKIVWRKRMQTVKEEGEKKSAEGLRPEIQ